MQFKKFHFSKKVLGCDGIFDVVENEELTVRANVSLFVHYFVEERKTLFHYYYYFIDRFCLHDVVENAHRVHSERWAARVLFACRRRGRIPIQRRLQRRLVALLLLQRRRRRRRQRRLRRRRRESLLSPQHDCATQRTIAVYYICIVVEIDNVVTYGFF